MSKAMRRLVRAALKGTGMRRERMSRLEREREENANESNALALMPHEWQVERTVEFWEGRN